MVHAMIKYSEVYIDLNFIEIPTILILTMASKITFNAVLKLDFYLIIPGRSCNWIIGGNT